jgi:hypothetical protein
MFETTLTKTSNYNNKTKQVIVSTVRTQPPTIFHSHTSRLHVRKASTFLLAAMRLVRKKRLVNCRHCYYFKFVLIVNKTNEH